MGFNDLRALARANPGADLLQAAARLESGRDADLLWAVRRALIGANESADLLRKALSFVQGPSREERVARAILRAGFHIVAGQADSPSSDHVRAETLAAIVEWMR